jgi:UDP-glucose 4-epimerase
LRQEFGGVRTEIVMARCLVTGGAGFIGSHLVEALVAHGHCVRVLDSLVTGDPENLDGVRDQVELVAGDITELSAVRRAAQDMDYVFHQAALCAVPPGGVDPLTAHHTGATGTLHVLIAALEAQVRRVIYAASSSAYGNATPPPARETHVTRPLSPKAVAKLAGEEYCVAFHHVHGLETVRLRYFSVFGPRQPRTDSCAAVIPGFIDALAAGRHPVVHGDARQSRDFTYVGDVVQANLLAMEAPRVAGRVYNVATGRETTLAEVIETLNELMGTQLKPIHASPRPGHVRHSHADISLAQVELGFCPCTDLRQDLGRCVEYYTAQGNLRREQAVAVGT